MSPEQARALFLEHCQPGDRGTLERYGEKAAVAAIMAAVHDLLEALQLLEPWLASIADCDMAEVVADGGITAGMVVQQEAAWKRTLIARVTAKARTA